MSGFVRCSSSVYQDLEPTSNVVRLPALQLVKQYSIFDYGYTTFLFPDLDVKLGFGLPDCPITFSIIHFTDVFHVSMPSQ